LAERSERRGVAEETGETLSFEALEERHFLNGDWAELIALYERRLDAPALRSNEALRARVLFRLAQTLEERVGDVDTALERYLEVARLDAGFRPAFAQLRRLNAARGRFELALQVAEHEDPLPMRPMERAVFHTEVAELWAEHMDDPAQALEQFDRALACAPDLDAAARGRAEALTALGRAQEAALTYAELLERTRGAGRAPLGVALARLQESALGDEERAFESFRRALTDDPASREALEGLATLAARRKQWPLLAELQDRRFELAESADALLAVAFGAAELERERLERPGVAAVWYRRVLELDPDHFDALLGLATVAGEVGASDEQVRCLERALELNREAVPGTALLQAATAARSRGDWDRALGLVRAAQERAPEDPEVLDVLASCLRRRGGGEELALVIERQAALAGSDPARGAELLEELGRYQEEQLEDVEAALDAYRRAFALEPGRPELGVRIERLLHKSGDLLALRTHLESARTLVPEHERARVHSALGGLLADGFADLEGAVRCYEEALQLETGCEPALRGLEQIARASGDDSALVRAYEREAALTSDPDRLAFLVGELVEILERGDQIEEALMWAERLLGATPENAWALGACARLHEQRGEVAEQITMWERLQALQVGAERADTQRSLARALEARGDDEAAIRWGQATLEIEPGHSPTLQGLLGPLERTGRYRELADAYRDLAAKGDRGRRLSWLEALATLLADGLGAPDEAIPVLQELADDPEAPPHADDQLEDLLEQRGRFDDLVARLALRQSRTSDAHERRRLELRRARLLLERLERPREAASVYRALLESDADCEEADHGLEQSLLADGDLEGVIDLLGQRAARAPNATAKAWLELAAAELLDGTLGDLARARERYAALADSAADPQVRDQAAERLEGLLERTGDFRALYEHLQLGVGSAEGAQAVAQHERLAQIASRRLGEVERAALHLEAAAEIAPERAHLWSRLGGIYEELGRPEEILRVHSAELAAEPPAERELVLHARSGALRAEQPGAEDAAEIHYRRVLELCPSHAEAIEFLCGRFEREGRAQELADLLAARLARLDAAEPGSPEALSLRLRLAELHKDSLQDAEGAVAVLEPALRTAGALPLVAERLALLYQETMRAEALVDLSRAMVDASEIPAERAGWSARLGQGLVSAGRDAEATRAFHQALADRPGDREVHAALCDLYRQAGEAEPLARLLETELAQKVGAEEIEVRLELAELLANQLDRAVEALPHLRRVLEIEPDHESALERRLVVAEKLGRHDEVLALLDARLGRLKSDAERAPLLARRARLLAGALDQPAGAAQTYRRALRAAPGRAELLRELETVLERLGRHPERLDLIHTMLASADPTERAALLERGAALAREHISPDASLTWLERLRAERPCDSALLQRIATLHRAGGRHGALLRVLEAELAGDPEPERVRELQLERAQILDRHLGLPLAAAAALELAHAAMPDDVSVAGQLAELYARGGLPRERARVLATVIALVEPTERNRWRCELARLHRDRLREPEASCGWLEQAVAHPEEGEFSRAELLRDLGASLTDAGRIQDAAQVAERELEILDPAHEALAERRVELHRSLAHRYAGELANPARALAHLRALVDGEVGRPPVAPAEVVDAAELTLLDCLRRDRNLVELARRLRQRLDRHPDDVAGWLELARLHEEQLHRPGAAAEAFEAVLERRPDHLIAWRGLRKTSERLGDWRAVARALEGELAHDPDLPGIQRAALLRRLGEVAWARLGSTTRASHAFAGALEAHPGDLGSLRSLERLLEAMEDWRGALDLYESEVETLGDEDPERRQKVWLRVARLATERTCDPARALRAFEAAAAVAGLPPAEMFRHSEAARAAGERERAAAIYAQWCDHPQSAASPNDHVVVAAELEQIGETRAALARAERAVALDSDLLDAWELTARLRGAAGDATGRAEALVRASELLPAAQAARRLEEAARSLGETDPGRVFELLRRAVHCDPASASAQAALALCAARAGDLATAESAALAALDLDTGSTLAEAVRAAVALEGGRAAQRVGHLENAAQLFQIALALDPESEGALGGLARILLQFGSYGEARPLLERRLARAPEAARADDLARLGSCLERLGETESALARFREAAELEPDFLEAHEGCVRNLGTLERPSELAAALYAQAEAWGGDGREAAHSLTLAAECLIEAGTEPQIAEAWLERATRLDKRLGRAWLSLARKQNDEGRHEALLETLSQAMSDVEDGSARAEIASMQGRGLEARGERSGAAIAFREAAQADARRLDDALAASRLFRALGEWREATAILEEAGTQVLEEDPDRAAFVFHQLGRLRAGPLEDLEGALRAYERALECDPGCTEAERALADLLVHRPERRPECIERHRRILEQDPHRVASLRALVRLESGGQSSRKAGLALLAAIGCATPEEREQARGAAAIPAEETLLDPLFERARQVACAASHEIALALETATPEIHTRVDDPVARFRTRTLACAAELSAAALLPLPTTELRTVLTVVAGLSAETESVQANGHLVNALAGALGRRARKRVRRVLETTTPEQIAGLDFDQWRAELQALAATVVLRRKGGQLRTALLALLDDAGSSPPEGADLSPLIQASAPAGALYCRQVRAWIESLDVA
jgi:tetratricopeptide (TPR) repeat protein